MAGPGEHRFNLSQCPGGALTPNVGTVTRTISITVRRHGDQLSGHRRCSRHPREAGGGQEQPCALRRWWSERQRGDHGRAGRGRDDRSRRDQRLESHACVRLAQRHGHGQPLSELLRHQRRHLQLGRHRLLADHGGRVHDREFVFPRLHHQRRERSRGRLPDRGCEPRDDPSQHLSDDDRGKQRDPRSGTASGAPTTSPSTTTSSPAEVSRCTRRTTARRRRRRWAASRSTSTSGSPTTS